MFVTHLLSRNIRYEAGLVDQFFDSSEKRLARVLLLLAHFDQETRAETAISKVDQTKLGQLAGLTWSQVSHLMNKFRKLGFIDYSGNGGVDEVQGGLLQLVLARPRQLRWHTQQIGRIHFITSSDAARRFRETIQGLNPVIDGRDSRVEQISFEHAPLNRFARYRT